MTDLANLADRFCKMNCPVHATEQGWPHDPDCETLQAAVRVIASARIKRDKDRERPVERPQLEYDHTQEGTANFERALSQVRALENAADLSNSTYAAFMAERDDHLRVLTDLAHQYLSDLRYPPSSDSRERRIERIEAVLREVQP